MYRDKKSDRPLRAKYITYTREIIFCYECPFCVIRSNSNRQRDISFHCLKSDKHIRTFRFANSTLAEYFLHDLPRKFYEYSVVIPPFCKLENVKQEPKRSAQECDDRQLKLFPTGGNDDRSKGTSSGESEDGDDESSDIGDVEQILGG